jgi:hypothetical protein
MSGQQQKQDHYSNQPQSGPVFLARLGTKAPTTALGNPENTEFFLAFSLSLCGYLFWDW